MENWNAAWLPEIIAKRFCKVGLPREILTQPQVNWESRRCV